MEKIPLREVVVVEGRYDKIRLESVVDAAIMTTEGFRVFNDREKQAMLRRLAEERGLLVITDSDGAGNCTCMEACKHMNDRSFVTSSPSAS